MQTHPRWPGLLFALALVLACASTASAHALPYETADAGQRSAQPAWNSSVALPPTRSLRVIEVGGRVALASPVGMVGAEVSINLRDWWTLRVGFGGGMVGPQISAMTALRLPLGDRYAIGVGTGVSTGMYDQSWLVTPDGSGTNYGMITWWNSELFVEARGDRFALRPFVGIGIALNADDEDCYEGECVTIRVEDLPLIGVALAWELGQ